MNSCAPILPRRCRLWLCQSLSLLVLLVLLCPWVSLARPLVRNIKSTHEWDRLLKKHGEETGLPVIVDFYSDSCGPCRMMAPIFQKVAKQYLDKAVFVKIDTNAQYELSSRYQVRSLPTFQFYLGGKKVHQAVGGIGEAGLIQEVNSLVRQAEAENIVLELEALVQYYQTVDATKSQDDIRAVHQKCVDMTKSKTVSNCVGGPASQLARKLKQKYKTAPKLIPRFTPEKAAKSSSKAESDSSGGGGSSSTSGSKSQATKGGGGGDASSNNKPNLHLATKEQLLAELEKRLDEERDAAVEQEDALELEEDPEYHRWIPTGYPEKMVVIGGGPAGWAAAIYGARAGLKPLVIAPSMGGQLQGKGVDVENYPGVANSQGPALVAAMRQQAIHFGATVEDDIVMDLKVGRRGDAIPKNNTPVPLTIVTNVTGEIQAHTVVVATGAEAKWLNVPGEWELRGGGVSSCATCDGFLFANRHVVVVGGGDAAMEDALVLARTSSQVTVLHRRDAFRASKVLADRVLQHPLIKVRWNTTVQEILGRVLVDNDNDTTEEEEEETDLDQQPPQQKVVQGVVLRDAMTGATERLDCDAVFVAIGHTPSTSFLSGSGVEFLSSSSGYLRTFRGSTATSILGLFAAGDVADAVYRQAITSAGSGAAAALDAERYLSEYGLGREQDDLEAELLAELHGTTNHHHGSNTEREATSDTTYNVYEDWNAQAHKEFARESIKAEL